MAGKVNETFKCDICQNDIGESLDRLLWRMARRQVPILVSSLITGAVLIYFIGFWPGAIVNAVAWGALVFLAKIHVGHRMGADPFRDDRYMLDFFMALVGR